MFSSESFIYCSGTCRNIIALGAKGMLEDEDKRFLQNCSINRDKGQKKHYNTLNLCAQAP
jgi:hypothetical protein